jgi:hypothetical protein
VTPGESCRGARLHGDDGVGLGCWVGSPIADNIVGGHISDRL